MTIYSSASTRYKVGIFTVVGLVSTLTMTLLVNNRPYWWRPCQFVKINVEDATGLKTKSSVRSLGIEIGYLSSVELSETHVALGICLTAPVEVLPNTKAFIRGEGFLGDKFVELKPLRYLGNSGEIQGEIQTEPASPESEESKKSSHSFRRHRVRVIPLAWNSEKPESKLFSQVRRPLARALALPLDWINGWIPSAQAADPEVRRTIPTGGSSRSPQSTGGREIPVGGEGQDVQHLVGRVDELVQEMSGLTLNLKKTLNPDEMKRTMDQLNLTLQNANRTLSPEGGINQTAQRTLAKLEDAIEQLRDQLTRINKGEGSVGMLLNDPSYADEIRTAIKNVNLLLNKVGKVRFVVDLGGQYLTGYQGGRGWFQLGIWPNESRYYLLGVASDSRGRITNTTTTTTTTVGGTSQTVVSQSQVSDQTSLLMTAMLGKVFWDRLDLAVGILYGDGAASAKLFFGPSGSERFFEIRNDVYFRTNSAGLDDRLTLTVRPLFHLTPNLYVNAAIESIKGASSLGVTGPVFAFGAGITFDDEDIKLLFAFK